MNTSFQNQVRIIEKIKERGEQQDDIYMLEEIREELVCKAILYEEALARCIHSRTDLYSADDPKYQIYKSDIKNLLEGESRNMQISLITNLLMCL